VRDVALFTDPALGRPGGNESPFVAILASEAATGIGQQILKKRIQMKKTRKESAKELGVSVKTLWGEWPLLKT
jgi:hypothetical protein